MISSSFKQKKEGKEREREREREWGEQAELRLGAVEPAGDPWLSNY